jgi:transcriptional regulator GlxA family with amidase domain
MPNFSLALLGCAVEAFRLANDGSDSPRFVYSMLGLDRKVRSNDGLLISTESIWDQSSHFDLVFLISSLNAAEYENRRLAGWLRRVAKTGATIAPLGAATVFAAKAGLLDGFRCTTHWQLHDQFATRFPHCRLVRDLYCIDRSRVTCAGGFSAMDLGLTMVARMLRPALAWEIAEFSMFSRIRDAGEHQRSAVSWRYGTHDERVSSALELMEESIASPIKLSAIADRVGLSLRQLERLFEKELEMLPHQLYLDIRMKQAHDRLSQSSDPILSVALQCGFSDAANFTRACKAYFGETPSGIRLRLRKRRKSQTVLNNPIRSAK